MARPGVLGIVGKSIEKRCRGDLRSYFRALGQEIKELHLEQLVDFATKETARHAVELKLANVLRNRQPILKALLEQNMAEAMLQANNIHHFAEAVGDPTEFGDPVPLLTGEEAALWASVHAGQLIPGIDSTTQELIADAVEQGIEDHLGVNGTARLIRATLEDMTTARSQMIASTEMNAAFSEATMRKLDRLGVEYKQWITSPGNVCDECSENEDASPIPIDEDFPSGDSAPPAHPNCRCAVTGARAPEAA